MLPIEYRIANEVKFPLQRRKVEQKEITNPMTKQIPKP
jgi:hypothetical protein